MDFLTVAAFLFSTGLIVMLACLRRGDLDLMKSFGVRLPALIVILIFVLGCLLGTLQSTFPRQRRSSQSE